MSLSLSFSFFFFYSPEGLKDTTIAATILTYSHFCLGQETRRKCKIAARFKIITYFIQFPPCPTCEFGAFASVKEIISKWPYGIPRMNSWNSLGRPFVGYC